MGGGLLNFIDALAKVATRFQTKGVLWLRLSSWETHAHFRAQHGGDQRMSLGSHAFGMQKLTFGNMRSRGLDGGSKLSCLDN